MTECDCCGHDAPDCRCEFDVMYDEHETVTICLTHNRVI